jgi:DinB family protein
MKKLVFFASAILLLSFISSDNTISKKERKTAVALLKDTENGVFSSVKGLSDAQLKFKPAPDKWSVEECLKHIAISEKLIRGMIDGGLKQAANPEKRAAIKSTDDQIIKNLEDRSTKIKTIDPMKPENTPFKSATDALDSFKGDRDKLIDYMEHTSEDLRDHVLELPIGTYDCYQLILLIGSHSNRHTQQIEEVKADHNFPKN